MESPTLLCCADQRSDIAQLWRQQQGTGRGERLSELLCLALGMRRSAGGLREQRFWRHSAAAAASYAGLRRMVEGEWYGILAPEAVEADHLGR